MHAFQKILWIFSTEPATRDRVASLVQQHRAELTLASIAETSSVAREESEREIRGLIESLESSGAVVNRIALESLSYAHINDQVVEHQYDLVAISEGSAQSNSLLHSTAQKLMRNCPCGVWVDDPDRAGPVKRVLAAIDPSESASRGGELGKQVIRVAAAVARAAAAELHVLHTWRPLARPAALGRVGTPPHEIENVVQEEQELRQRMVDELIRDCEDSLKGQPHVTHVVQGAPEIMLPEHVAALDIDLFVIGTWARTGIAGLLFGNIAESVLGHINCAVLAVKSEDFGSELKR